jgi:hypothetical protein
MSLAASLVAAALGLAASSTAPERERIEAAGVIVDFPPGLRRFARTTERLYLRSRDELSARLGIPYARQAQVVLVESDAEFESAVAGHRVEPWAAAVAIPSKGIILIRGSSPDVRSEATFAPLLRHEVCHLVLAGVEEQAGKRLPLWFNEGLCQWAAGSLVVPHADVAILDRYGFLHSFYQIEEAFPSDESAARIAYLQSEALVRFIADRRGIAAVRETLRRAAGGEPFHDALRAATGVEFHDLQREWRDWLRAEFSLPYLILRSLPFFALVAVVVVVAYAIRRIRDRRLLRRMEVEEQEAPEDPGEWDAEDGERPGGPEERRERDAL